MNPVVNPDQSNDKLRIDRMLNYIKSNKIKEMNYFKYNPQITK